MTGDSLRFLFRKDLEAEQPEIGSGQWSSTMNELKFDHPNERMTTVTDLQLGNNVIYWEVSNGSCPSSRTSITIKVADIKIPTAFSPNGDCINDYFEIVGAENATSSELIILDTYNNVVFESKSYKGKCDDSYCNCTGWWDGRSQSGKELPSGVYFFQFTLNGEKIKKGYVVLKR
jgi:gliding motility-associated-like protein